MRRFPALTRLLAVLLLLQWGTAFAHCLPLGLPLGLPKGLRLAAPAGAATLTVEICTADGLHRIALPVEEGPQAPSHATAALPCPACLGPGALALPEPAVAPAPSVLLAQAADPPPPPRIPAPQPPPSCQPRAPPTS